MAGTPAAATVLASEPPPMSGASSPPRPAARAQAAYSASSAAEASVRSSGWRLMPPCDLDRGAGDLLGGGLGGVAHGGRARASPSRSGEEAEVDQRLGAIGHGVLADAAGDLADVDA